MKKLTSGANGHMFSLSLQTMRRKKNESTKFKTERLLLFCCTFQSLLLCLFFFFFQLHGRATGGLLVLQQGGVKERNREKIYQSVSCTKCQTSRMSLFERSNRSSQDKKPNFEASMCYQHLQSVLLSINMIQNLTIKSNDVSSVNLRVFLFKKFKNQADTN